MIRIEASNQAGTKIWNLDVQHTPVEFEYSIQEMRDISNSRSPHSLRFSMPMTDNNNQFFGEYYNVNFESDTFDSNVKTHVQVFDSGVAIMVGVLQLHKVTPFLSKYEVSILAEVASFFDAVKDLSFEEIFITDAGIDTDLDHALTSANITNSWDTSNDITSGNVGAGVIVYPLSDWGLFSDPSQEQWFTGFFQFQASDGSQHGMGYGNSYTGGHLTPSCFKPAIRVNWLLNRIAQKAGFTINSDFFSTDASSLYMFLATEVERTLGRPAYGSKVGLEADFTLQSSTTTISTFIPFTAESPAPYNDVDGLFNSGVFVAPVTGYYWFHCQFVVTSNASPLTGSYPFNLKVYKNYDPDNLQTISGSLQGEYLIYGQTQAVVFEVLAGDLEEGDTLTVFIEHSIGGNTVTIKPNVGDHYSFFQLLEYNTAETFVDVSSNFPDLSVGEYLTELFHRFNLMLYSYPDSPTVIYVEPYNSILSAAADKKDWTEKIDANTMAITPTTKFQSKNITFEDGEGKDWINSWWQEKYGYVKGRYIYENPNEFATGNKRLGGAFQPIQLSIIPFNYNAGMSTTLPDVLVPRLYDASWNTQMTKELVEAKPIHAFYHGKKDIGTDRSFRVGGFLPGAVEVTQYPFFSEYNTSPVTTTTIGLSWGLNWGSSLDHPLINAGNTPGVTNMHAYRKFWARRIHEEYSSESRFMTCQAYLTPLDVNTLRWNDEIFIDDSFWRVIKVSNFSTGQEKPANLELIKLINSSDWNKTLDCAAYPATFNVDGTVNFVDLATGAAVSPTEPCCTENGFVWDDDANVCFWKSATTGSDGKGVGGNPAISATKSSGLSMLGSSVIGTIPMAEGKSLSIDDVFASKQSFYMTCKTTDNANTAASSIAALTDFDLVPNAVYMINVDAVTVDTGGSAATIGNVMTMRYQGTVANTAGTSRNVGQTLINSEADGGAARTITINQKQDAGGRPSQIQLLCAGETNKNITWILDVEIVQLAFSDSSTISDGAIWNLTSDPLITLNLSTNQYLTWNL